MNGVKGSSLIKQASVKCGICAKNTAFWFIACYTCDFWDRAAKESSWIGCQCESSPADRVHPTSAFCKVTGQMK